MGVGFGGGWDQRGASGGGRQSRVSAPGGCFQEKRGWERKGARSREPPNRVKSGECSGTLFAASEEETLLWASSGVGLDRCLALGNEVA